MNPLARTLFGDEYVGDTGLDSHKAFVVSYKIGQDVDLGYHYDNAEVTLNVSLGMQSTVYLLRDNMYFFSTLSFRRRL